MIRGKTTFLVIAVMLVGAGLLAQDSKPSGGSPGLGKALQDAAKAAIHDRVAEDSNQPDDSASSDNAALGLAKPPLPVETNAVPVLSSLTHFGGVNFAPYFRDLSSRVRQKWFQLLPDVAQHSNGKLAIEFAVLKDGRVTAMKLLESSGDVALDRAAWAGIANSAPFDPLPASFNGNFLKLCFRFYYNPGKAELKEIRSERARSPI